MSRPLSLLVLLTAPVLLIACEGGKSSLLSAKPGECYSVVGRDSLGAPKVAKIPCASQQAALTCPPPTAAAPHCSGVETKASGHKTHSRKVASHTRRTVKKRQTGSTHYARYEAEVLPRSGPVASSYDYARVDSDLLGGAHRVDQDHGYARSHEQDERSYREERYAPPPPPVQTYSRSSKQVEQRAYAYEESSSYSSRSGSSYSAHGSSGGRVVKDCNCDGSRRVAETHSGRDAYGYLTWPGKTPR